jgi:hypothetical protein
MRPAKDCRVPAGDRDMARFILVNALEQPSNCRVFSDGPPLSPQCAQDEAHRGIQCGNTRQVVTEVQVTQARIEPPQTRSPARVRAGRRQARTQTLQASCVGGFIGLNALKIATAARSQQHRVPIAGEREYGGFLTAQQQGQQL